MVSKLFVFLFLLLLASCQNSRQTDAEQNPKSESNPKVTKIMSVVEGVNTQINNFTVANSLAYRHNDGSTEEVFAYLDKSQQIVKIEEKFKEGSDGNSGVRNFYFENGKKIMSQELFIDLKDGGGNFRERLSFYDKNGRPFETKERITQFEEDLEKLEFKSVKVYDCSMETADQVLNQKGVFATTFQGFASDGPVDYLIVGGPGESGFASALAVQYADGNINYLKANQERLINTPLLVEFEKMMDERKLEFQILTRLQIEGK